MSDEKKIVTGLGKPELHRVLIRGHDLTKDLVGKITFSDMTYLMLVGRFPSDGERRMTDALLTILVEHGMVSSVVSARLCYSTAPEAMQAASRIRCCHVYQRTGINTLLEYCLRGSSQ